MANEMLVAALAYAKRGWAIFPVGSDKKPLTKHGVQDATTNPEKIEEMWARWPHANIALNVGEANMMVLDLDPGHDIKELKANVGSPLPETLLSSGTPRGGRHLYYAIAEDEIVAASASKLAPHVDVRSFHSYVLLPPSRTKDGEYTWISEGKPAFRTDEILRLANAGRDRHRDHDTWIIEADLQENINACPVWLRDKAKVAIDGQGGDQCAYDTAAMCKSFGISEALAFDLMWKHWNPRCLPPWSADEVDHFEQKIENGYSYNTSPPGNVTPAYKTAKSQALFSAVEREELERGNQWTRGHFRGVDRAGMASIKPPAWLFEDFLTAGSYAMIFGPPSTFKTFIALDIALTVAAGGAIDQTWPKLQDPFIGGAVCFVAGEGRSQMLKRVQAWEKVHFGGREVSSFKLVDPVPNITQDPELFIALLEDLAPDGYKLVVIDTAGRAMQGVNENAQEHASAFTRLVEVIQAATGATVLVLHHSGHAEIKRARGSSVFGADVDTMIRVEETSQPLVVRLKMLKQKDAQEWREARTIRLIETHLSPKIKSLVAVPASPAEEKVAKPSSDQVTIDMLDCVEAAALAFLARIKTKNYSKEELAVGAAHSPEVTVGWSQINKKYLPALRDDSTRKLSRCYDIDTKRWRWQD